jgi:hypothetical protein
MTLTPLQASLDAIAATCGDAVMAAKLRALMRGYAHRYANNTWQVTSVEDYVSSELYNPETQRTSRTFQMAGKMDLRVIDAEGKRVLVDHKTTSEDVEDPMAAYWKQLVIEGQANHYLLLEWLNGRKVDYAIWDVVRKPTISPRQLTKAEVKIIESEGKYGGYSVHPDDVKLALQDGRETPNLYEARLSQDCIETRPERYFQRRRLLRLDNEVAEYAQELWEQGQEIISARRNNRHMRNSGACMNHGSACRYLSVCSGHDSPESAQWKRKEWVHNELIEIDGTNGGRDLLTNSRVRSFQTCRRKHFYDYELGIEPVKAEDKEALIFGDLWHKAQEAFWRAIKTQQENHHESSFTESENDFDCASQPETVTV